jgi:hypothetical protein
MLCGILIMHKPIPSKEGNHRYCDAFQEVEREGPRQARMSLTWSAG